MMRYQLAPGNRRGGFTLIELLVVVTIIGVLSAIAIPKFQKSLIKGRLETAKPLLAAIAGKMRAQKNEYGQWVRNIGGANYKAGGSGYSAYDERYLIDALGIKNLKDIGDYCFMARYKDATAQNGIAGAALDDNTFEVWAILRGQTTTPTTVTVYLSDTLGSGVCTMSAAENKAAPSEGFGPSGTAAGGAGRVVVLRYPPPVNGTETTRGGRADLTLFWTDGITTDDPIQD